MWLWQLIKKGLRRIGIEAMRHATYERLERDSLIGQAVYSTSLNLLRLLVEREFSRGHRPVVLQIGANDGQRGDALWAIRDVCNWRGVLVEPQPEPFAKLCALYRDTPDVICENVAIGPSEGQLTLYRLRRSDGQLTGDDLTAASREKLERTMRYLFMDANIEPFQVPVMTPSAVLRKNNIEQLDILVIDTEGMDAAILGAFDFNIYKPIILQFEIINLTHNELDMCLSLLKQHHYQYAVAERDIIAWLPPMHRSIAKTSTVTSDHLTQATGCL